MSDNLLPKPDEYIKTAQKKYKIPDKKLLIRNDDFSSKSYCAFSDRSGCTIKNSKSKDYDINLISSKQLSDEEYILTVNDDGISITASSDKGVIWAFVTLYQIIDRQHEVLYCHIHDNPKYPHRGLSIDCARQFYPINTIMDIIEQMSLVKLNVLHWHLTDDQGWRIESTRYPKLHQQHGNEFYSHAEIIDLIKFADTRGVEIIPEIDIPGHVSSLLAVYPQYSCTGKSVELAQYGGIYPIVLCAGNESIYDFLDNLFDEIGPLFSSKRFHIGGDEAPKKEWEKCVLCQSRIKESNLLNETELQGYFTNRVVDLLEKHGKKAICWVDSLMSDNVNPNISIQHWYLQYPEMVSNFIETGGNVVYSDMFTLYFDYPHSMTPLRRVYKDEIRIADKNYSDKSSLAGIEACIWSEHIFTEQRLEELLFPRLYAVAEIAWSKELNYNDFCTRLRHFMMEFHNANMNYTKEELWDPVGKVRQNETFAYLGKMSAAMPPEIRKETLENAKLGDLFHKRYTSSFFEIEEDAPILAQMNNS